VGFEELVTFPGDILGIAFNVDEDELASCCSAITCVCAPAIKSSARAGDGRGGGRRRAGPRHRPARPAARRRRAARRAWALPIERPAVAIMDRAPVTEPLQTGIKVIDALILSDAASAN